MSTGTLSRVVAGVALIGLLGLTACTAAPGSSSAPTSSAAPTVEDASPHAPEGRVIATGTVLDVDGDVQLCLGAVAESYPPQCSGLPVDGWTWDGVDGSETSGVTTWGTYAVYGTFDGERYTITDPPIMLALYDPIRPEDPTGGVDGTTSDADLARIQDDLVGRLGDDALGAYPDRGYVWLSVLWDDGTIQDAVDAEYDPGVVVVTSALRPID